MPEYLNNKLNEQEFHRRFLEERASEWHLGSDPPYHSPLSSQSPPVVLITSPILQYAIGGGIFTGLYDKQWFLWYNCKRILHPEVSYWRYMPPMPKNWMSVNYDDIKARIEEVKKQIS